MKHIFTSIGLVRSQNTDPIGCENTMVSQHRSDKVWKHHYYFCEKKQEKSIMIKNTYEPVNYKQLPISDHRCFFIIIDFSCFFFTKIVMVFSHLIGTVLWHHGVLTPYRISVLTSNQTNRNENMLHSEIRSMYLLLKCTKHYSGTF